MQVGDEDCNTMIAIAKCNASCTLQRYSLSYFIRIVHLLLDDIMVVAPEGDRRYLGCLWIEILFHFFRRNSQFLMQIVPSCRAL